MQLSEVTLALLLPAFLSLTALAAPVAESGNLAARTTTNPQSLSHSSLIPSITTSYQPSSYSSYQSSSYFSYQSSSYSSYQPSSHSTYLPSSYSTYHPSSYSSIVPSNKTTTSTSTTAAAAPTSHQESLEEFEATHDPNNPADQETASYLQEQGQLSAGSGGSGGAQAIQGRVWVFGQGGK